MYHEIEEARDTLFKSDHEFSCESEDEDEKVADRQKEGNRALGTLGTVTMLVSHRRLKR